MAYADFKLEDVVARFGLTLDTAPLFSSLVPVDLPASLVERLADGRELALTSEKARSEFIIAPILLALRRLSPREVAVYSGQRFDFDPTTGLMGECDFILAATKPVPILRDPIISVIEAKRDDIALGYGQCAAQMVASLRFNQSAHPERDTVYGCVTIGDVWQFLRLRGDQLTLDSERIYITDLPLLLSAFLAAIAEVTSVAPSAA